VQTESLNTVYEKFKQHYKKIDKELGDTGTRKITIELDNAFNTLVFRLGLVIGCTQSLSRFYF
jgi:hypothetical protein